MEQTPEHVLIVSHDNADKFTLAEHLKTLGYSVEVAKTGQQARHSLRAAELRLVLLNVVLPDIESHHLLRQLHADKSLKHICVLLLATAEQTPFVELCLENGADDVIYRPFHPVILKKRIANWLQFSHIKQQLADSQKEYYTAQKLANDLTQIILPIGLALSNIGDFDRLLEKILRETKAICNADGGNLYLLREQQDSLKCAIMLNDTLNIAITRDLDESLPPPIKLYDPTGAPNHSNMASSTALLGLPLNVPDIYRVKEFELSGIKAFDKKYGYRSRACLTVPLKDRHGQVFGVLQLINPKNPQTEEIVEFDAYMQQVAEALASLTTLVLTNRILLERQKELLRLEDELNIGQQIQTSFLPETLPQPPGWEIAARLDSARETSGDFYDVFTLGKNHHVCVVVADVCDKGLGAALFMVLIRTLIRAFAEYGVNDPVSLQSVVKLTNDYLLRNHFQANMFASLFIGMLDPVTGEFSYVNNGHPSPVLIRATGEKNQLLPTGPVIGAFPNIPFTIEHIRIEPQDVLFAFTDGVTDARSPKGNFFPREELLSLLETPATSVNTLLDHIQTHIKQHIAEAAPFDDVAMLIIRHKAQNEP